MKECYYSYVVLWHQIQLTKNGYFEIRRKRKNQWKVIFKMKVSIDPVKYCETYKKSGCAHVDGILCDITTCTINKNY